MIQLIQHVKLNSRTNTAGVIKCEQAKILDYKNRNAKFIEVVPEDILEKVKALVMSFVE